VPAEQLPTVVEFAKGRPLHFHVSEQRAENEACLAAHGVTPVQLLAQNGALGPRSTAVHATHLTDADRELLTETTICMCPTTERDLADGIGRPGANLSLGSDSHAIIDLFEEARAVELNLRLATERRGHFTAHALLQGATNHASLGWPEAGQLQPGALADFITVGLDSPRLETSEPETLLESIVFAATAADVHSVVVDGRNLKQP
jgi:cytosine/adenosine deaminase-related metal-dependent hydrolase